MDEEKNNINGALLSRLEALARRYSELISGVFLSVPLRPAVKAPPPAAARKYPLFQELSALKQEIIDDFSKAQLDLRDMTARLAGEPSRSDSAVTGAKQQAEPAVQPPRPPARAAEKWAAEPVQPAPSPEKAAPAAAPEQKRGYFKLTMAVLAAALAVSIFFVFGRQAGRGGLTIFPLPHTRAAGLCLNAAGDRLFFADPQRQLLFTVSGMDGQVKSVQAFPAEDLSALAFDGVSFWSSDGKTLSRHGAGPRYQAEKTYSEAGSGTVLLYWDGKYLWAGEGDGGKLRRYRPEEMKVPDGIFAMPAGGSAGIAVEDGALWKLDPSTAKLGVYALGDAARLIKEADLSGLLDVKAGISGFAMDKAGLWVVTENPAELRLLPRKDLRFYVPKP